MHRRATFRRLRRIDLTPSPFGRIATYLTHQPQLANSIARHKSRRDSVLQPRVGVFPANPGKRYGKRFNPNGVASTTRGSRKHSNRPNPFRVATDFLIYPGLAEPRQPWAGGLNPFGILRPDLLAN